MTPRTAVIGWRSRSFGALWLSELVSRTSGSQHNLLLVMTVTVRSAKRAMLARISSAVLVQTYGWPAVLEASMNSRMADSSDRTPSWTPRRNCFVL